LAKEFPSAATIEIFPSQEEAMRPTTFAKTAVTLVVLGMSGVGACSSSSGGGATCSSAGHCAGDKPADQMTMATCNTNLGDAKCGAKYQTVINCFLSKEVCVDGGGDPFQTLGACAMEYADWMSCAASRDAGHD
jgi:hypothetical protein